MRQGQADNTDYHFWGNLKKWIQTNSVTKDKFTDLETYGYQNEKVGVGRAAARGKDHMSGDVILPYEPSNFSP